MVPVANDKNLHKCSSIHLQEGSRRPHHTRFSTFPAARRLDGVFLLSGRGVIRGVEGNSKARSNQKKKKVD